MRKSGKPSVETVACEPSLRPYLVHASAPHRHLCPRQILGVRIGLAGVAALGLTVPREDKRLLVLVETDGCFVSGVQAVTGSEVNRRTLRVVDYGKIAATFVDVKTEAAVRVAPRSDVRERAWGYADSAEKRRYFAMLVGYQRMPDDELLAVQPVRLTPSVKTLISRAGVRVNCDRCGEEIINEREQRVGEAVLCIACAGGSYYAPG